MELLNALRRFSRLRRFEKAARQAEDQDFVSATLTLSAILESNAQSVSARLLFADVLLFQENFQEAFSEYCFAESSLQARASKFSQDDLRFLTAYIDFRKLAVRHCLGRFNFSAWKQVSGQIRKMEATPRLKRVFSLPE
jgi:hypothetical protein